MTKPFRTDTGNAAMTFAYLISREPRTRTAIAEYLRGREMEVAAGESYDDAMEDTRLSQANILIVDVQGLPRGESGATFGHFSHWLAAAWQGSPVPVIYLLHKGARKPNFRVEGTVIKKPFPFERLGEALRECLGQPRRGGAEIGLELDLKSNTLRVAERTTHLTNIEASLLSYLMEHQGEILQPRDLLVDVWQYHEPAGAGTLVRAHVSNLRRKLRDLTGSDEVIQTIRGKGYRFVA